MEDPLTDLSRVAETRTLIVLPGSSSQFASESEQQVNKLLSEGWGVLSLGAALHPAQGPLVQLSVGRFYGRSKSDDSRIVALRLMVVRAEESPLALNEPEIHLNGLLGHERELWIVIQATPMLDREGPFMLYILGRIYGNKLPEGVVRIVQTKLFAIWPSSASPKTETKPEESLNRLLKGGWEPVAIGSLLYPNRGPVVLVSAGRPYGKGEGKGQGKTGGGKVAALRAVIVKPTTSVAILNDAQIYLNGLLEKGWNLLRADPMVDQMGQLVMVHVIARMRGKAKRRRK